MAGELETNQELNAALQEFEDKSPMAAPMPQASSDAYPLPSLKVETPKMVRWIMKLSGGAIKDEAQANYVLLGIAILIFGFSMYLFFGGKSSGTPVIPINSPIPGQTQVGP